MKSKDNKQGYKIKPDVSGKWAFLDIPPGVYHFEVFCDSDGNGKYSFGNAIPFEYAEPFWFFGKEIEIRPRWKVEDLVIQLTE